MKKTFPRDKERRSGNTLQPRFFPQKKIKPETAVSGLIFASPRTRGKSAPARQAMVATSGSKEISMR